MYKIVTNNPKKTALKFIYGLNNLMFNKSISLDMRFKSSYEVLNLIKQYQISETEKKRILALKKERSKTRIEKFENVLSNKLVKDYLANKFSLTGIYSDHLVFGSRNHWAKNETDLKVLDPEKTLFKQIAFPAPV